MKRTAAVAILVLAAIIAAEPLFHEHPLRANEAVICAVCAAGSAQIAVHTPAVTSPLTVVWQLVTLTVTAHHFDPALSLPSRAPPTL